jgi:site-specific DNA recombinase
MEDVLSTDYHGCERCLVATRRLSRKSDATSSPQRQAEQDLQAMARPGAVAAGRAGAI